MDLMEDIDPEEARRIVDPALKRMIDAAQHYGGHIVQSTGDGIFALFGAPIAHEDHPQRALFAALRLQDSLKRYSDTLRGQGRVPLQARVGLNTGEVVVRSLETGEGHSETTPIGHAISLAARMQALAPVGSIAATEATRKLGEGYFTFKSLGRTLVKGVSEPVEVFEVTGLGPLRTRLQRAAGRGYTKFVGREHELEALRRAAELAQAGHGQLVGMVAMAGVGKSRLLQEFKSKSQLGWRVLEAFSVSHGRASAYLPVLELLGSYFKFSADDNHRERREKVNGRVITLDRSLEDTLPYLFALLGIVEGEDPLGQMDAQIRRRRTQDAVKRLLLRESLNQSLMLVFEDLHWIDEETQSFLDLLVDSIGTAKILLLVNYRPEYTHKWGNKTYYTQLRLDPLGEASAYEMLRSLLGDAAELNPLKRLIVEKTEGNPLFMEEVILALLEDGSLARNGSVRLARAVGQLNLPPTVQGILAARIDRLPAEEKELLQTLAVLGMEFSLGLVREIGGKPGDELNRALSDLQLGEFIYEQPTIGESGFTFKHALTQEVAYSSVLTERRRTLHRRIGEALEALYVDSLDDHISDLAHHYSSSDNPSKAIEYLWFAANQASRRSLYSDALGYSSRGLNLLVAMPQGEARTRDELRMQMTKGAALMAAKGFASEEVEQTFSRACELAREIKDPFQELVASQGIWGFHYTRGDAAWALKVAEDAVAGAPKFKDAGLFQYAHYALGASLQQVGRLNEAREHLEKALAVVSDVKLQAHPIIGPDPRILCLTTLADVLFGLGYPDQSLRRSYEALGVVKRDSDPFSFAMALLFVVQAHCARGEARKGEELCRELIELCDRHGFPYWLGAAKRCLSWAKVGQGRWEEGIAMINERLKGSDAGDKEVEEYNSLLLLAEAYGRVGKFDLALSSLEQWLQLHGRHPIAAYEKGYYRIRGELLVRAGSLEEAEQCLRRALELSARDSARMEQLRATASLARLLRDTNRRDEACAMLTEIYKWFTEGFDSADLKDAKALLEELSN
jgi:class 3 adenylate cyclase/Flp pilus assembly protein TadD